MGSYLSIVNDTNDTYSIKVGTDEAAVGISSKVFTAIADAASIAGFAGVPIGPAMSATIKGIALASTVTSVATGVEAKLQQQGYTVLRPGERKQYGKMTLSLWQQCVALRTRLDGDDIVLELLNMRPIFSGPLDNSNNDHSIQWWINKWGHEERSRTRAFPTVKKPVNKAIKEQLGRHFENCKVTLLKSLQSRRSQPSGSLQADRLRLPFSRHFIQRAICCKIQTELALLKMRQR
jgi:hypothetical protein